MTQEHRTRVVNHNDGRIEIIRILDDNVLEHWTEWNPLAYEASIVWLETVEDLDYARMMWITRCTSRRNRLVPESKGRILGYSKLTVDAPQNPQNKYYTRRVFYRLEEDDIIDTDEETEAPTNAVVPSSVLPGVLGTLFHPDKQQDSDPPKVKQWSEADKASELAKTSRPARVHDEILVGALVPENDGDPPISLNRRELTVGRSSDNDVVLPEKHISSIHCRLIYENGALSVIDLNSTAGVRVNGRRVTPNTNTPLAYGDTIAIADKKYKVRS